MEEIISWDQLMIHLQLIFANKTFVMIDTLHDIFERTQLSI